MQTESTRDWSFTLNNYDEGDEKFFKNLVDEVRKIVVGKEVGEQGTPHLQGRIIFRRNYRFTQLKKLHKRVHWETTKAKQDNIYCLKRDSVPFINIDNRKQGKRTDFDEVYEIIKEGGDAREVCEYNPGLYIRFSNGIDKAIALHDSLEEMAEYTEFTLPHLTDWKRSHIIVGPAGTGKTQWALSHFEKPCLISQTDDLLHFNARIHDGLVFDDMEFGNWPRSKQIHLLDQDQNRSIKCRYKNARIPKHTKKIFTCNTLSMLHGDSAIDRRCQITRITQKLFVSEVGKGNTKPTSVKETSVGLANEVLNDCYGYGY